MMEAQIATLVSAELVPWENGVFGVSLRYSNGNSSAYRVGSREAAESELKAVQLREQLRVVK